MDDRARLLLLSDTVGTYFGTEDFCIFLYSLIKMQAPHTIVELGTGMGNSACWMALAAKQNGAGHVWSVDDLSSFKTRDDVLPKAIDDLMKVQFGNIKASTPQQYFEEIRKVLEIEEFLTFINEEMYLDEKGHFDHYPFGDKSIDLLFSDFRHGPQSILKTLAHFLPRMSPTSSIFFDSASTHLPSYLFLELLISHLNNGRIPQVLQNLCNVDLHQVIDNRRIVLVHLTESKRRNQNSRAWLKIEPADLLPQPVTYMRY
jgi:Methyltransferase domain